MYRQYLSWIIGLVAIGALTSAYADEDVAKLPEGLKGYGKLNVSLQQDLDYDYHASTKQHDREWNSKLHSNASRLGAKGKYGLNDDLSMVYKVEYEVDANDGYGKEKDFFNMREVYAGVSSKTFGTVEGGKIDSPLKMLQIKVDQFLDLTAGDAKNLLPGKNRDDFTYLYRTPTFYGLTASMATIDFKRVDNESSKPVDQRGSSISLSWAGDKLLTDSDKLYVAVARDNGVRDLDINRIAIQYKFSDFTLGALAQDADKRAPGKTFPTKFRDESGYFMNAAWDITPSDTVKVQWGRSQQVEKDGALFAVGYDHKISKDLKVYVFHSEINGQEDRGSKSDRTLQSNGIGVEYAFDLFSI
jgi:predicted porin